MRWSQARSLGGVLAVVVGLVAALTAVFLAACGRAAPVPTPAPTATPPAMAMAAAPEAAQDFAPLVRGFYQGRELSFIHTEASDVQVASMLTAMMGPLVVQVPSLAEAPDALTGTVYVFTNGVAGDGPFGFQPDVFDSVPGDLGYTPLRRIVLVSWNEGAAPRELRSVEEVREAESLGQLALRPAGAVVNMPILAWPGGHR